MNEEKFKQKIEERWGRYGKHREKSRMWGGLFMLAIGGLLLARASGAILFPTWFFTWPVFLIGIGLFVGVRHGFRGIGWLIPIAIGGISLADRLSPELYLRPYLWPILLIVGGLFVILRPKHNRWRRDGNADDNFTPGNTPTLYNGPAPFSKPTNDGNDVIDVTAIFGGVKKNLLTKNFKGGDIVAFMGGAEINLSQADFTGKVSIDCFNMFGGTKLIVPPDWEVQNSVVAIFGGVDDKRPPMPVAAPDKILFLEGTCIFGGLEIKSY